MKLSFPALVILGAMCVHAQIASFQHVVVIVQENRTPDNLFQGLCSGRGSAGRCSTSPNATQYNIQTANWLDKNSPSGVTQPAPVALANAYDLSHAHGAFLNMCNAPAGTTACKMDGAGGIPCTGTCVPKPQFKFVDNSKGILNPYLTMATQYGWANYMFQTNQGPSFPAHQFLFGGTSAPSAADDAAGMFAAENMSTTGIAAANGVAGCIAPSTTTVDVVNPNGAPVTKIYPCFEHQTMADILPSTFSWRYYSPSAGSIWTAPDAIQHICQSTGPDGKCTGPAWTANVDLTPADVLKDISQCNLRSMSWVIPSGQNSDHANVNDGGGPSWVAAIVNAIGNSSNCDGNSGYWRNTAIFIVWDDWGGWYDHEPPTFLAQPGGDYQYGFRVPLIVVSAYTPEGYIDNQRHDFGSILRFVEHNFGITQGALNFADARSSTDLTAFFKLTQAPRQYRTIGAPKSANFFLKDHRRAKDPDDQ